MAGNLYDEALTALDQRPPATLPSPTPTPATPAGPSGITDPGILAEFQRRRQTGDFRLRSSFRQAGDTTPDQAADARRLAIKFGAPPSVVLRDLDQYRQREASATAVAQTRDTPHLAGWLSDPDNASVAHDDVPALGAMETGLAWGGKLLGAVKAGYYGISAGMTGAVQGAAEFALRSGQVQYQAEYGAPVGEKPLPMSDNIADQPHAIITAHLIRQHLQEKAAQVRGVRGTGLVERGILGGVESLTQAAVLLPLSIATGSPAPMLSVMGTSTFGTSYGQTRDVGGGVALSAARGGFDAAVEVATEYIPAKWLLGDLAANAPLRTMLLHQLAGEIPGEEVATALQDLSEWAVMNPEAPFTDYLKARPGAFAETLIATVVAAGVQSGGVHIAGAVTQKLVTGLGQAATASKTQKRSPEAVESFVAQATKDSPAKAVYAPVDTWTTYWQSKGQDPAAMATSLTGDPQAYQKAVELGTDLEIPIAKYAAKLAGTEHNTFFAQELKLDPAEMNAREAAAHVEQLRQQQETAQPTEQINPEWVAWKQRADRRSALASSQHPEWGARDIQADAIEFAGPEPTKYQASEIAQPSTLDQATDLMTQRMVEQGIPQDTAQTYGAIWRAGIGTLASNFGIDPLALQAQYGPQGGPTITREGMEPAPQPVPAPADMPVEQAPEGVPVEAPTPEPQAPDTILAPDLSALTGEALAARAVEHPQAVAVEFLRRAGVAEQDRRATERSAETDPLTGLGNGRALRKALPAAEADPNTSVLFFDANNFKQINKTAGGHEAGDVMLQQVASAVQQAAAEVGYGARAFRRAEGGDEFVVLVPREMATQVRQRAETLFGAHHFINKEGQPFEVSLTGTEGGTAHEAESQLQAAKDARKRAPQWAPTAAVFVDTPATITDTEALHGTLPTPAGDQIDQGAEFRNRAGEHAALATGGLAVPEGVGVRGERGGLPAAGPELRGLPDVDEVFRRESGDATAARFTPDVTRELARIADELRTFPFEANVWVWDDPLANYDPNFGTAAGGKAKVISGNAGAPVYHDILAFSPVNTSKGQPAKKVRGSRADVVQAIHAALEARDIPTNLAEGAMRVAEHRAAGDYYYLSQPQLPHRDAPIYPNDEAANVLEETDAIEPVGDVDTSFDPTTFKQEQRGEIRFGADRQFNITLLERADLSTFLHETGHFFLEVFGDLTDQLAARDALTPEQQRLRDDHAALLTWLGVESRAQIGREQHEQFARGFEAYLMEGKAPSLELRSAFARARAWLLGIYRNLRNLNVTLTPEVRGIFDRLLASDAAIQQAQQTASVSGMFLTAESAGMSEADFANYRGTIEDASRKAKEELDRQILAEVQREQTATWKAQREQIKEHVTTEVQQQPVYRALAAMQKGTHPSGAPLIDGETTDPLKLSKTIISERYGAERLKSLPKPYIYSREGGLDPDTVAEMFGFSSGDALMTAVSTAPSMRSVIERETAGRMFQQHGSLLLDGTLGEKAQAAVANDSREAVIRKELKALHDLQRTARPFVKAGEQAVRAEQRERAYERRWLEAESKLRIAIAEGHKQVEIDQLRDEIRQLRQQARGGAAAIRAAIPSATVIRQAASEQIARTRYGDIKPQLYWSAGLRAGRQATEFAARQQFPDAVKAKQQQLFNLALYREAIAQRTDMDRRVAAARELDSPKSRARIGLAGGTFQDQIDGILDQYDFARVSQKALDRRADLRKWIAALEGEGFSVDLPADVVEETRRIHYRELTVEQLIGVTDALKQIVHLARQRRGFLKDEAKREYGVVRDGLAGSIYEHGTVRPRQLEIGKSEQAWRTVSDWYASHVKLADFAQSMDGGQEGGPMWEAFVRPVNDAANAEETRSREAGKAYAALLEQYYPGRELGRLSEKRFIPAINGSLSKEAILALAQNQGTESNKARLLTDSYRNFTEPQIAAVLDTLDKRDWDFVQAHFDYLETYWSEIAAKMKRVTGVEPEKVPATPIVTKFGTYRGGYHPLVADTRLSPAAAQHDLATQAKLGESAAYLRTTTRRGHEQARVEHADYPVRLELGVTFKHLSQVIHDLTHHEMLIDTTRLLRDPKVRQAIVETQGDIVYSKFSRWLQDIALGDTSGGGKPTIADKAATFMRTRTQVMAMAYNLWTAMQQPLGIFNGMSRVGGTDGASNGVYWVSKGMSRWLRDAGSMENTIAWIREASPMMAARFGNETGTQDLRDLRASFSQSGGWFDSLLRTVTLDHLTQQALMNSFLWHIGMAQRVADVPTWLGMYEKQMAHGETEDRAIALADQAVIDSQGGGQVKDLAEIQRGGPIAKLFMSFASYGVTVLNANARATRQTNFRSASSALSFLGHLTLLNVMPALGIIAMRQALFGGRGGDDDESWATWIEAVGAEMLGSALNGLIFVRELSGAAQLALGLDTTGGRGYGGPAGMRAMKLTYDLATQIHQGEADAAAGKAVLGVTGFLLKFPSTQMQKTIDGWVALQEGRTSNPVALIVGPPPKGQ